jgi:2-hydroxy-3-oxopropionate reductase
MNTIGFIGLGIMGKPMARNLIQAGYDLIVHDIASASVEELVELGAKAGTNPREVAEQCDLLLTMLPNSPHVRTVMLGDDGVIHGARQGMIAVDMSSIDPLEARAIAEELGKKGIPMLDAPVSGGEEKAKNGQLAFMVGGDKAVFEKVRPILDIMGGSITLVGDIGAGNIAKLANQSIVAVNIAVVAEALTLAKKAGVDPQAVFEAIRGGLAGSSCMNDKAPRMFAGDFAPGFKIRLHAKDLSNVFAASHALHAAMPLTAQVMEMVQSLLDAGHGELDHGGLALHYEKISGTSLAKDKA